ncbi:uncharacterized protein LOC134530123 isoform X5 [Bacillus rossius redtenbacheri]|uniref:uncharacterized protein LOC134530123 isoform X5 n=1 Tax=Bacillus rossius redtenbacheri TaxID=93214 RepID=UPI002FDDC109
MATVPALSSPFQQRDVAEWSRLDRLTGVLERARRETDHWKASRGGHTGNYNKVVDCRARNAADGSLQQRHKKQLEVFQAQGPGGSLQVIRTQSVTSTSSGKASPWLSPAFDNLQLTLNPLDLSSQKTKASVGRSGSIGGRRPPSRPRSLVDRAIDEETGARLSEVSRLCQQIHEDSGSFRRSVSERRSYRSSGSTGSFNGHEAVGRKKSSSTEDLPEEVDEWRRSSKVRRSLQLSPRSSVAAEDLPPKGSVQKLKQELEGRRRLDIKSLRGHEAFENVLKRGEDIINSEALGFRVVGEKHEDAAPKKNKRNSFVTVESLKEVRERLRRTGSPVEDPSKDSEETDDGIVTEDFTKADNDEKMEDVPASRVKSYVYGMETQTKSGREVRKPPQGTGSLESRTSNRSSSSGGSRTEEWYNRRKSYGFEQVHGGQAPEQPSLAKLREKNRVESSTDSGICRSTEAVGLLPWHRASPTKLKSDDAAANNWREPHKVSRINNLNSVLVHDEKSFEGRRTVVTLGVETANKDNALFISEPLLEKPSSEGTVGMKKSAEGSKGVQILIDNLMARENRRLSNPVTITIPITSEDTSKEKGIVDNKRQYFQQLSGSAVARNWKRTPVTLNGHDGSLSTKQWKDGEALQPTECELKRHSIAVDESKYVRGTYTDYNTENGYSSGIEQSGVKSSLTSTSSPDFAKRHGNLSFASSWSRDPIGPGIHVSFTNNTAENKTTAEEEDDSDQMLMGKKTKRVEFCKTEVHFAAEPGRFNIVETNEKPPPTNMFRRRRRSNPVPEQPKSGLPEVRFGDSPYEKSLLASADVTETVSAPDAPRNSNSRRETFEETGEKEDSVFTESNATIFPPEELGFSDQTNENQDNLMSADSQPKGILKNNRKPRPFHLGEETDLLTNEESSSKWSTPLRSVQVKEEESRVPWRSNVMLRQSADNVETRETELQKLLKSLRPASQRRSFEDSQERKSASEVKISVADRVRQVESKGYSTKVNFGVGEATVVEHPPEDGDRSKPSWLYKEEPEGQDAAPNVHRQHQVSVATAVLPSYADSDRLRSVETLVSTRSGRPKITSISLRYDSDHPTPQSDRRRSARPELSPPRGEAAQKPACRSQDAFMQTDFLAENQSSQQKNEKFHSSSSVFRENVYMGHPKTIKLSSVKKFPSPQPPKSYLTTEEKRSSLLRDEKNFQHVFHPSRKELSSPSNRKYENVPLPSSKVNKYDDSDHDYEEIMPLPISQTPVSVPNNAETRSSVLSTACDRKVAVTKTTASCHRISPSKEAPDVVKPSRSSSATRGSTTPVHHSGHERKRSPSPRSSSVQRGEERKAYWAREERAARHRSTSRGRQEAPRTAEQRLEDDMLASESRVHQSAEACRRISAGKDADSAILEELTRAADQILQAVNGYTDEESRRASSDEDGDARHRKGRKADQVRRPAATLGTISEGQATRRRAEARPRPGPTRVRTSRLGPTSSTSSVESFTKETRKTSMVQARLLSKKEKSGSLERPGRTARLLQRATSREQLLSHGSSSEDIAPGDVARRPRAPRRSRPTPSSAGDKKESLTQTSAKARREPTETSRTRDKSSTAARSTAAATKRSADANISSRAVSSRDHGARLREEVPRRSRTSTHAGVLSTRRGTERPARGAERSCGVAEKKKTASESPGSSRQQSRALKY